MLTAACDARQSSPPLLVDTLTRPADAGLHGASVGIMGRREAVVKESSEALEAEHIRCLGVQVSERGDQQPLHQTVPQQTLAQHSVDGCHARSAP